MGMTAAEVVHVPLGKDEKAVTVTRTRVHVTEMTIVTDRLHRREAAPLVLLGEETHSRFGHITTHSVYPLQRRAYR